MSSYARINPQSAISNPQSFNIAQFLPQRARATPQLKAVVCPHAPDGCGRTALTFDELDQESDWIARGLAKFGLQAGQRTLLMLRPGLDFIALTFALFKCGAVPVLIDPGMGRRNLLQCIAQARPEAMIAIPLAHAARVLLGHEAFENVGLKVTVGRRWFWGGPTLDHVRRAGGFPGGDARATTPTGRDAGPTRDAGPAFPLAETTRDTPAAILFTSGGTGVPKGVLYTHGMFGAQVEAIRQQYGIEPGEVDLPAFPLFALFSTALGTTCVIPDMDPSHPARCDPAKIVRAIQEHQVTYTFGSPAIWKRVGPYCLEKNITLPSLKRILMAGAPVRGDVLAPFAKILTGAGADTHIPYGATEALPVASIRGSEVLRETWELTRQGRGYCVGYPLPGISIKIVGDAPVAGPASLPAEATLPAGTEAGPTLPTEIGEIVVSGEVVTREYYNLPEQTREAKFYQSQIGDPQSKVVWHRMGDMGYFDAKGRLWFCGRKAHRVLMAAGKVLYSVCVEAVFENALEQSLDVKLFEHLQNVGAVPRAALVGIGTPGNQEAAIVLELTDPLEDWLLNTDDCVDENFLPSRIADWHDHHPLRNDVPHILQYPGHFPVDVRHNAKIKREELAVWAQSKIKKRKTKIQ